MSMPIPERQTRTALLTVSPHSGPSLRWGLRRPSVDDRRQVLLREPDVRGCAPDLVPADDVDSAVAVLDDGGDPVHHRFLDLAAVDQPGVRGFQREAAVEGRDDAACASIPALRPDRDGTAATVARPGRGRRPAWCGSSRSRRLRRRTSGIRDRCGRWSEAPASAARRELPPSSKRPRRAAQAGSAASGCGGR